MNKAIVLIVEDDESLREVLSETLQLAGYQVKVACNGEHALKVLERQPGISLVVSDVQMQPIDGNALMQSIKTLYPQLPVILMTAYGTVEKAVNAMRYGASDYLIKPFEAASLVSMVNRFTSAGQDKEQVRKESLKRTGSDCGKKRVNTDNDDFIAVDQRSQELAQIARRVAATDVTVMITGESGVGKEVISRYIHQNSLRAKGPFLAINCAAIPENMLESVLFGYEKGAFTGAYQSKAGKFEQAQGGTLLLDEVTEMDLSLQAKLLRVLQEREVERLGGRNPISLDVRIIATTNRDFHQVVAEGNFREDLFYRLNVFPINILPLRDRVQDVLPLAQRLLERYSNHGVNFSQCFEQGYSQGGQGLPISLSQAAKDVLVAHPWPGNVRELDNVMQRAVILKQGNVIDAGDIHFEQSGRFHSTAVSDTKEQRPEPEVNHEEPLLPAKNALSSDLMSHEKELIMSALASRGSRKAAAEKLGISPRTLRYKLARLRDAGVAIPA